MVDLGVEYLGVRFENPIVVTACSMTRDVDGIMRLVDAGAGGIVTKTISEDMLPGQSLIYLEHRGMQFVPADQRLALVDAVPMIAEVKNRSDVPVIANIIGVSDEIDKWIRLAQAVEAAGADLIEIDLNAHLRAGQDVGGVPETARFQAPVIGAHPEMIGRVVSAVAGAVDIPVVTKISPTSVDLIGIAKAAIASGTDGISLLNALGGLPGVDIRAGGRPLYEGLVTQGVSSVIGEAVAPSALWTTARFGILFDTPMISGGGVMNGEQSIERIMLGAHLVGVCAALYRDGHQVIRTILSELEAFLDERGHESPEAIRGDALAHVGMSEFWDIPSATQ